MCEVLEKMGIAQKLPDGYETTYDYLVDPGYAMPETRRLPHAGHELFSLNAITRSGTVQTIATASYKASTTGFEVGRFVFLEFRKGNEECVEVMAVRSGGADLRCCSDKGPPGLLDPPLYLADTGPA